MRLEKELVSKPHKYPVTIRLDEDDLPELKSWKVGGKYTITLEVEQLSMSKGDEYGEMDSKEKPKVRASFKVLSASSNASPVSSKRSSALNEALKKRV